MAQQFQASKQEHTDNLMACCDDDQCLQAMNQAKAQVEAAGLDWAAFIKTALTAFLQILPGLFSQQSMQAMRSGSGSSGSKKNP